MADEPPLPPHGSGRTTSQGTSTAAATLGVLLPTMSETFRVPITAVDHAHATVNSNTCDEFTPWQLSPTWTVPTSSSCPHPFNAPPIESIFLLRSQYFKGHTLPTNLHLVKIEFFNSPLFTRAMFPCNRA